MLNEGVQIMVSAKANILIPPQIRHCHVFSSEFGDRVVRWLTIPSAQAYFVPGGAVAINITGGCNGLVIFDKLVVFEIRDDKGNRLERNHFFCKKCIENSGEIIHSESSAVLWRLNITVRCEKCDREWTLENV